MNNKTYEQELEYVESRIQGIRDGEVTPIRYSSSRNPVIDVIIQEILTILVGLEERVIATDKDGNVKLNKNGKPKVDWLKVIGSLGFIVGRIVGVIIESKKLKQ